MKKRLSAILLIIFALSAVLAATPVDEKRLLKMVPADAEAVVSVNATEWFSLPVVQKSLSESPAAPEFLRQTGISFTDLTAAVFWCRGGDMALLGIWKRKFDPERIFLAPRFTCKKVQREGRNFYFVKSAPVPGKKSRRKQTSREFWVASLPGGVTGFFSSFEMAAGFEKMAKGAKAFVFPASAQGALRAFARGGKLPVKEFALSCSMTGAKRSDFSAFASCECATPEEAAALRSQMMLMCNLMLVQSMQNAPELAAELIQKLKFDVSGNRLFLTVVLPEKMLKELGDFAQKEAAKKKLRRNRKKVAENKGAVQKK